MSGWTSRGLHSFPKDVLAVLLELLLLKEPTVVGGLCAGARRAIKTTLSWGEMGVKGSNPTWLLRKHQHLY